MVAGSARVRSGTGTGRHGVAQVAVVPVSGPSAGFCRLSIVLCFQRCVLATRGALGVHYWQHNAGKYLRPVRLEPTAGARRESHGCTGRTPDADRGPQTREPFICQTSAYFLPAVSSCPPDATIDGARATLGRGSRLLLRREAAPTARAPVRLLFLPTVFPFRSSLLALRSFPDFSFSPSDTVGAQTYSAAS